MTYLPTSKSISRAAHESIKPVVPTIERAILRVLHDQGPHTCDAVEVALELRHQTASSRFCALHDKGWIRDTGNRLKTRSGRKAAVYGLTLIGLRVAGGQMELIKMPKAKRRGRSELIAELLRASIKIAWLAQRLKRICERDPNTAALWNIHNEMAELARETKAMSDDVF